MRIEAISNLPTLVWTCQARFIYAAPSHQFVLSGLHNSLNSWTLILDKVELPEDNKSIQRGQKGRKPQKKNQWRNSSSGTNKQYVVYGEYQALVG